MNSRQTEAAKAKRCGDSHPGRTCHSTGYWGSGGWPELKPTHVKLRATPKLRVERITNGSVTSKDLMSDYAFFEYRATITNLTHDESEGESVHCLIRIRSVDKDGKRMRNLELEKQAGDDVLFVLNPGPHRKVSHSSISAISEEAFQKAGTPLEHHQVGDCEVLVYRK